MNALRIHLFLFEVFVTYKRLTCLVLATVVLTFSLSAAAQNSRIPPNQLPENQSPSQEDEARSKLEKEMAKKANQERQAALKKDTDKLLKLATELKEYVDKTNENTLSMDVVKKAEEIEKLAHSVKDKMKGN
jgi:predicted  nucleic acid-binding Zn-ribbon protein